MIASAQIGDSFDEHAFVGFGHSMIVDPWGDIIAQCSDKEGYIMCEIDLGYLDRVRSNMNCLSHIRTDLLLQPEVATHSLKDRKSFIQTNQRKRNID